jgi:hypothetical protein
VIKKRMLTALMETRMAERNMEMSMMTN